MILCCGEALIDMIPAPTQAGIEGFVPHPGGAVFNTAIALGRLGACAGLLTGLSDDMFGRQLAESLAESRVNADHVIRCSRPTTLAFVQLEDGHASYAFFDENSAGRMLQPSEMPHLPESVTAVFFGGISLACEPGAEAYADLLARQAEGRAVMIDPNIRPEFIRDADRYRKRLAHMIKQADIIKVSDEDLNWIDPAPDSLEIKAERLLREGAALVIVTRGSQGAVGFLPDGSPIAVPARKADIADTVGAGDTFNAGVLAHLSQAGLLTKGGLAGLSAQDAAKALEFGAKVAAVTVSRAGANPPWAGELDQS